MSAKKKYQNPPIVEAVCELRIAAGSPWDLAVPGIVYEELKGAFPKRRQFKTVEASLIGGAVRTQESERLQCLQEDEKSLVTIGRDSLQVSRLKPYLGWETFRPVILDAFKSYAEITRPTRFQRLGLRYVNQMDFKEERVKLEDFFEFYPFLGPRLPEDHGGFIAGVEFVYEGGRDNLRLQLASGTPAEGFKMSFLLDLDYFLVAPTDKVSIPDLENWLTAAHSRLGDSFEGCLTDAMRNRFQ